MSEDKKIESSPLVPIKNRKQRRFEAKLKRSNKVYKDYGVTYWVKRIIGEMKDSKAVQEKVVSGQLDKYLK